MVRRYFLASVMFLLALPSIGQAEENELSVGIYPGTGTAEMLMADFRAATLPFAQTLADSLGLVPRLTMFRTIKSTNRSLEKSRLDVYFVPPTVAVSALDQDFVPVARVKDLINAVLIRRKGGEVSTVALTEKESLPDVLGRAALKRNKVEAEVLNLKTQEDVAIALERGHAQAGGLTSKMAQKLLESGNFEVWFTLPASPGFTLMASTRLTEQERTKLGNAAVALKPELIQKMQKAFVSKLGSFIVDKDADFKTLKLAMKDAGYLD